MKKHPVTLIEMIIAMALTIIILTTLTFFYRQVGEIDIETERVINQNFQKRYAETRLAEVLPRTISETDRDKDFVFMSVGDDGLTKPGSQSLIFTFDNKICLDKKFSNHVIGRIFLDGSGNLTLAYWPSPKRWKGNELPPMKKEILLGGVDNLTFEFYVPPSRETEFEADKEKKGNDTVKKNDKPSPEPKGAWSKQFWLAEYQQLPAMVRIYATMSKEAKPIVFAFPLPNGKAHITYKQ